MTLRLACITNHLNFLIRCLQSNIVPLGLCLKLPIFFPDNARQIVRRAEELLMKEKIRDLH